VNPTITKLALQWLTAERKATAEFGEMVASDAEFDQRAGDAARARDAANGTPASSDEMAIAVDRVYHVLRGEVRWSETSPGDKAVWRGRIHDAERFESAWRGMLADLDEPIDAPGPIVENQPPQFPNMLNYPTAGGRQAGVYEEDGVVVPRPPPVRTGGPRLVGYRTRRWWNYYDTVTFRASGPPTPRRLFERENIGNPFLCNMQVPGMIGEPDAMFAALAFYVHATDMDGLRWAADHVQFTFGMGDMPQTPPMFVRDLFVGIQLRRPITVPIRQHFWATCDWNDRHDHRIALRELEEFQISFHIDGMITREELVRPRPAAAAPPRPPPPRLPRIPPTPPRTIRPSRPRPSRQRG
jgi:hypothetical protein